MTAHRRWVQLLVRTGLLLGWLLAAPAIAAISPEERLSDPQLEDRARTLSRELRCLVCQNQSIDDSDADLARDLRSEVRRLLSDGLSDQAVLDQLQQRYGDYILLKPPVQPSTWLLWLSPLIILGLAAGLASLNWRKSSQEQLPAATGNKPGLPEAEMRSSRLSMAVFAGLAGLCLLLALLGYLWLGAPHLADQPFASRDDERLAVARAQEARNEAANARMAAARDRADARPDSVASWLELAMAAAAAGDERAELAALDRALQLTGENAELLGLKAEALARAASGQLTPPARQLIRRALALDPAEPRAQFLQGMAAYQDEDWQAAIAIWQQLLAGSGPDAPWRETVYQNLQIAAQQAGIKIELPDAQDNAARIEQMVAGLAERLADTPEDTEGWLRLARSYEVLDRPAKAFDALVGAAGSEPDNPVLILMALEKLISFEADQTALATGLALTAQLERAAPDRLEALFFRGQILRLTGKTEAARTVWQTLLEKMPKDSEAAKLLENQLNQL